MIQNKTKYIDSSGDETSVVHLSEPILKTEQLSIGYRHKASVHVLSHNLNLNIRNGELVCLLGKNGCGKSTLMRSIAGLQQPLEGVVSIHNQSLQSMSLRKRALLLSLVLTDKIEAGNLTVSDIVAVGRYPHTNYMGTLTEHDMFSIAKALQQCGLSDFTHRQFAELSDGEKQRVMIARALAQDTPLIMLDEPTAHLDLPNRIEMMKTLRQLAKETHKAILLSTHELDLALQWADTLWLMDGNGIICQGAPEDLVLNGSFSQVFSNHSFHFDMGSGTFKMKHEQYSTVNLLGKGRVFEWTRRALEREGIEPDANHTATVTVEVTAKQWLYKNESTTVVFGSIAELLRYMREKINH